MRRGRFVRNKSTIIFSVLVLGFSFYMKLSPAKFNNFTDIMSVALSFSSLATALFFFNTSFFKFKIYNCIARVRNR